MKKGRLILFGTLLATTLSLSGCVLFPSNEDIVVKAPTINAVSSLNLNLLGYTQKRLYPELSDPSIQNPVFEYTTSDLNVATVASDGLVTAVGEGKCTVTITLQSNRSVSKVVSISVVNKEVSHYKYTLMFYMCASDLEFSGNKVPDTEQWFFSRDIREMLNVPEMPDDVRIIIETGGTKKWNMPSICLEGATEISADHLQRWEINNGTNKLKLVDDTIATNHMADEASFSDFLSWGLDNYEADQMGVVLSGHGGGIGGCAYDDNYTDSDNYAYTLQTFEVANAAKTALKNSSRDKFTWIGYDCCLMQCADIATINSDYFEYMVASQELENATGWNHDEYLPVLKANPEIEPTEFLPQICATFLKDNHQHEKANQACFQTLSVLDLSKTNTLVTEFETVASKLGSISTASLRAKLAFKNSFYEFGEKMYGLCDFNSLLDEFNTLYSIDVTNAKNAVNDMVIHNSFCDKYTSLEKINPCGVNAFFPQYMSDDKTYALQVGREDYENKNSTKFTTWQKICLANGGFGW